jgi:predicted permease
MRPSTPFRAIFHRAKVEGELSRELQFHLEQETAANLRTGMAPEEARLAAQRSFGGVAQIQEEVRDAWGVRLWDNFRQDLADAFRGLRHNPGFALIVILTLGLGIGANTAIFSVVHGVLLRPLAYSAPGRLYQVEQTSRAASMHGSFGFSYTDLEDYRKRTHSFTGLAEYHSMWFILLGRPEPERVQTGVVSANFFGLLGVKPILGRDFTPEDDKHGAPAVLLLSNEYWQRSFGGDPGVVGRVFEMNDRPHTVIGVLPPLPAYPNTDHVFMPTCACPFRDSDAARTQRPFRIISNVIGRLADGLTAEQAGGDLKRVATELCGDFPNEYQANTGYTAKMTSISEVFTGNARTPLFVLLATAGFVLLIACANVANLTLARLVQRDRELAVRAAMGAGRARIFRQLLTENLLLSLLGGIAGLGLAAPGLKLLTQYTGRFLPNTGEITLNLPVLLFTLVVSVLTGLFFGSRPALPATDKLVDALKEGTRGTTGGRSRMRALLVVAQVAVSVPLLVGAGLTARSVVNLQQADPGIKTDKIISANIDLNFTRYDTPEKCRGFWFRAIASAEALPAAQSVGLTGREALSGLVNFLAPFTIEGRPAARTSDVTQASITVVNESYFSTVGQPLLRGRSFNSGDNADGVKVMIVNQSLASRYWPGEDPVGKNVSFDNGQTWRPIVGVVANVRQQLDRDAVDEFYAPFRRTGILSASIVVRTAGDPAALTRDLREALRKADPQQPVTRIQTMEQARGTALLPYRLTATLLGLFAALALVITVAGIGGVLAFSVSQRTQEIGIRMALGASRGDVLWMVLRQGIALAAAGLACGTIAAVMLSRLMSTVLYGVPPSDPLTYAGVVATLLAVAASACLLPARRATAINPIIALRAS